MSDSLWSNGLYSLWNSPDQNTGVGSLSLLQGIFPTQVSNPGLWHCRQILCQLSHKGSPKILQWVAYPFSSRSSWPRNQTGGLLHCRWILYQLSYQGSNKLLRLTQFSSPQKFPQKEKKFTNQHVTKESQHILWKLLKSSVWWQHRSNQIKMYEPEWGRCRQEKHC